MHTAPPAVRSRYEALGLASLSLASGSIDVLSFFTLGGVLTSAMTGNTALLAIAIGQGRLLPASRSLCALLGFTVGIVLATLLYARWNAQHGPRAAQVRILLLELVILGGCAILRDAGVDPLRAPHLYAVIVQFALSMGIQAVAARNINSFGINSIVFTSDADPDVRDPHALSSRRLRSIAGGHHAARIVRRLWPWRGVDGVSCSVMRRGADVASRCGRVMRARILGTR
jgi:hypothetical protein